jgi:hypothetical protein
MPGRGTSSVLPVLMEQAESVSRRGTVRGANPSMRALRVHPRMVVSASGPRRSTARILPVTLRREQKLAPKGAGPSAPAAIPSRLGPRVSKARPIAVMSGRAGMMATARARRRGTARVAASVIPRRRRTGSRGARIKAAPNLSRDRADTRTRLNGNIRGRPAIMASRRGGRRDAPRGASAAQKGAPSAFRKARVRAAHRSSRARGASRTRLNVTGHIGMIGIARDQRRGPATVHSVTLRRERSEPRRATARAVHPSRRAIGAHLWMTVNRG